MKKRFALFLALLSSGMAATADAATVTYDVNATVLNGLYTGLASAGTVSFDDAFLGSGTITLSPQYGDVKLSFGVAPLLFTEQQDSAFAAYPKLTFNAGQLTFIDYVVTNGFRGVDLSQYGVFAFDFANDLSGTSSGGYSVGVNVYYLAPVPLPAGLPLLAGGLGVLGMVARRRRA